MNEYTFDSLTLKFKTLGVPFLSDSTKERIAAMSVEAATKANRAAWKQRRQAARICNRHNNISVSGNREIYDRASQHEMVAAQVCAATFRVMQTVGAA